MTDPRIILLNDPTRGIDVGTKQELYRLMRELADQGAAIVFYYRFADNAAMQASYGTPEVDGADCTTEPEGFNGEHSYSRGRETGRLQCSTTDDTGERDMVWTDTRLSIEGFAFDGGDPAAMIGWWLNDAGPS